MEDTSRNHWISQPNSFLIRLNYVFICNEDIWKHAMNGHINHSNPMLRPTWQAVYCDANTSELLVPNRKSRAKS